MSISPEAHLEGLAKALKDIMLDIFKENEDRFKPDPPAILELKDIIEYDKRLRVSALDRFNEAGYVSAVNYYAHEKDKEIHKAVGAVVLYVLEFEIEETLKAVGYRNFDMEDYDAVTSLCGQLCKTIGERFKKKLPSFGYPPLIMTEPISFRNRLAQGVPFDFKQYKLYQIGFAYKKIIRFALDMSMAPPMSVK
jgi:hypothetical protein